MGATVLVTGDPAAITWIHDRGHRYFELDGQHASQKPWHIIAGKEYAPSFQWHPFERGIAGAPCTFMLDVGHATIVVDAPPGPWRKLWTLRLVRDLLRWQLFHQGAVFIHASVVSHCSTGIALVGKKRSGKSTLLLHLLRSGDFGLVAEDDMTVVRKPNGTFVALGWPGCLRIRRSMLKYFPEIAADSGFMHPSNALEKNGDPEVALLRLFPEEIEARFNTFVTPEVSLNTLVRLEWDDKATLSPLSSAGTAEALIDAWDILPERRAGARPEFDGGPKNWRDCSFNPPLLDFIGTPPDLTKKPLYEIAAQVNGHVFHHNGDPELLRTLLKLPMNTAKQKGLGNP